MTAASYTSHAFAATGRPTVGWRHVAAILGICLPVPICAASGLALPLPATVERIAASLVPWSETRTVGGNDALRAGVGGAILADPDERTTTQPVVFRPQRATMRTPHRDPKDATRIVIPGPGAPDAWPESTDSPAPVAPRTAAPTAAPAPERVDDAPSVPSASTPPAASTPSGPAPPATTTTSEPAPAETTPTVEQVVEDVVAPVKPVVDEVLAPVAPVVEDTTKLVDDTLEPVTGLLPGLGK